MHPLAEKVSDFSRLKNLFPGSDKIVVAVSGGLDSMVLLDLLIASELNIRDRLVVAHYNHQLRGEESDADEAFVKQAAQSYGLPFELSCGDASQKALETAEGLEAASRELRHSFFVSLAKRLGSETVALAHHSDDQIETFFIRLFRGAGSRGLAGMSAISVSPLDSGTNLVRPLFDTRRAEIEDYAKSVGIDYREDASNLDTRFLRNSIRHNLVPNISKHFNQSVHRQIIKTMQLLADDADCIESFAVDWLSELDAPFENLPVAIQRKVLQRQLFSKNIEPTFDLVESLRTQVDQVIEIAPDKRLFRKNTGELQWAPLMNKREFSVDCCKVDIISQVGKVDFSGLKFWFETIPGGLGKLDELGQIGNREVFDAKSVGKHIVLRHWVPGDRFQPIGQTSNKKLQDLFVNKKVPSSKRHKLVIAEATDGRLFWVSGMRIAEPFKVKDSTTELLLFHWEE